MKFIKRFDQNGEELPTFKQLGITNEVEKREMEKGDEHFNQWYDDKVRKWQKLRKVRNSQLSAKKSESDKVYALNHWYNSMPPQDKKQNIMRVLSKKDEIFLEFLSTFSMKSPLYKYYYDLQDRINEENYNPKEVKISKLKRLPTYVKHSDMLSGSINSFIELFIICFPPIKKVKKTRLF
jgi:hypothetical protein